MKAVSPLAVVALAAAPFAFFGAVEKSRQRRIEARETADKSHQPLSMRDPERWREVYGK